ncbi:hypothetical protein Tco_0541711, partial [Tanacetum coccineum]
SELISLPPSQRVTLELIHSQSGLKSIITIHHVEDLLHMGDPILSINRGYCLLWFLNLNGSLQPIKDDSLDV